MSTQILDPEQGANPGIAPPDAPIPPRLRWQARWLPAVLVGLSALGLTLAAPPFSAGWLGWLAPAPFFWVLLRLSATPVGPTGTQPIRRAARLSFLHGFLSLLLLVPWFAAFTPAGYPVAAAYWGLLTSLVFGPLTLLLRRSPRPLAPVLLSSGWTVLEWLRAQGTLAFPWGSLAATQSRALPVLQLLDLSGAYGLSFLMALLAASLAAGLSARSSHREASPRLPGWPARVPDTVRVGGLLWGTVGTLLLSAVLIRGVWILSHPQPVRASLRVGVVQQSESRMSDHAEVICLAPFWRYADETRSLVRAGAELVVWPECACREDARNNPLTREQLARLVDDSRAWLLVGSFVADSRSRRMTNSAVLLAPDGRFRGQYAKVHIVPFGEYLPARPLLAWTQNLGMPPEDMQAGVAGPPLSAGRASVGVSICFESAFGSIARDYVSRGANVLAVLTSDGWAGRSAAGLQHAAFAPLRAVETRRSVIRAAATGVSEIIDPYGRPSKSLPMFSRGGLLGELPLRQDRTLYSRLGDWPVGLAWLVLGVCATFYVRFARRRVN